jgi:hypothetical protein
MGKREERQRKLLAMLQKQMWRQAKWKPHALQKTVLKDTARNQVLAAGRRFGKTEVGGQKLVPYAFSALAELEELKSRRKSRRYWIVGPEYTDSEKEFRVLYDTLKALDVPFDRPGTYNNPQTGDMHISLWGGKFIVDALSAKHPETLVGEGLSGVVLSEAAKIRPSVYPKYIRPALADWQGWTYMGSTPEGRNWFYRMWQAGQDPMRPDWNSWRAPSWFNPYVYPKQKFLGTKGDMAMELLIGAIRNRDIPRQLPPESPLHAFVNAETYERIVGETWEAMGAALGIDPEIVSMALDLSTELFKQEIWAQFNEFVGRVFKDFDETIHVGDFALDPTWKTYAAIDYGFTNPFVWLLIQVDPFDENVRVLGEYYETGRTTGEAAIEIRSRGLMPASLLGMYPDPAEPDRSKELANLLQVPAFGHTGGPVKDRIDLIRAWLKPDPKVAHLGIDHPEWVPRLQFNRPCKNCIREHSVYRYPKSAEEAAEAGRDAPEEPMKHDDHTPEALGRFMRGHFGAPFIDDQAPARQRKARLGG